MLKNLNLLLKLMDRFVNVISLVLIILMLITNSLKAQRIKVVANETTKTVDVLYDNQIFTSFLTQVKTCSKNLFYTLCAHPKAQ